MLKLLVLTSAIAQLAAAYPHQGTKIVGGQESKLGQFPALVSLQDNQTRSHHCGGAIISDRLIVTAGHCFEVDGNPAHSVVFAGSNNLTSGGVYYELEKVLIHEDYDTNTIFNDIALLKTAKPIVFGDNVATINLPDLELDIPEGTIVTALGWGLTSYPNLTHPDVVNYIEVGVVPNKKCSDQLLTSIQDSQICVGGIEGKGLCGGDSGSPLILNGDTTIGIVSWGRACALGYPDVFTRTSSFVNWVHKNSKLLMNTQ